MPPNKRGGHLPNICLVSLLEWIYPQLSGTWNPMKSSPLTTFATPYDRFQWPRLQLFSEFRATRIGTCLQQELERLPGVKCIEDDILHLQQVKLNHTIRQCGAIF